MTLDQKTFDGLKMINWHQDWAALYSPVEASLDNQQEKETYFSAFKQTFGKSISQMLIVYTDDQATAWIPADEYEAVGTDTGGLTSHAAIVSRELGVPCIVGTKIATSVLKDGDMVEVDATKGIVRKI